jgi:sulfite exporter TauE/SafE
VSEFVAVLAAALITGVLGSAHCFGMCGGISGLFAVNASVTTLRAQIPKAIVYNLGRILSYAVLGGLVALLGKTTVDLIPKMATPVRLASGILIILVGLQLKGLVPVETLPQALGLGIIWGWLPCGLVYSVLLLAVTTTDIVSGALVMVAFGLGTMPAMLATGVSASKLAQFMSGKRLGAGLLIILLGLATLAMPVMKLAGTQEHSGHSGHNMSTPSEDSQ